MANNSSEIQYINYLNKVSADVAFYYLIISVPIGIPCNLISILVFRRLMKKNPNNMGFLGICQSCVDLVLLLSFLLLIRSSPLIFPQNLADLNDNLCRFLVHLRRFIIHASSWMPVIITFDRFTFVLYGHNNRFKFMKSKVYLLLIIFGIFVMLAVVNTPNFLFSVQKGKCTTDYGLIIATDVISITFRTYIPFTLLILFNWLMIRRIYKNSRTMLQHNSQTAITGKEHSFTISVIFYDGYFFCLNFPVTIYYILKDFFLHRFSTDLLFGAQFNMFNAVVVNLSYYENSYVFFIYMAFNKLFRREFLNLVAKISEIVGLKKLANKPLKSTNTVHPTGQTIQTGNF